MTTTSTTQAQESCAEHGPPDEYVNSLPGFDLRRLPVIAQHFFGLGLVRPDRCQRHAIRPTTRSRARRADDRHSNERR